MTAPTNASTNELDARREHERSKYITLATRPGLAYGATNCSPGSELGVFERMTYQDAIAAASAECAKPVNTQGWYTPIDAPKEAAG